MECNGCAAETKACNTHNCPRMLNIFCMLYYIISNKYRIQLEVVLTFICLICVTVGNCKWGPYTEWSECSKTCDGGSQNRTRVLQQTALNGGMDCVGEATQFRDCNMQGCPGINQKFSFKSLAS